MVSLPRRSRDRGIDLAGSWSSLPVCRPTTKRTRWTTCTRATTIPRPGRGFLRRLPIVNRRGLHARASAKFVQTVERFESTVAVTRAGETVGGRSIMGLLTLGAAMGTRIAVTAVGRDAHSCLDAIEALLANRFGEDE
ncbi:HPr family phosphocarrier protein [Methylobacterium persicinum]